MSLTHFWLEISMNNLEAVAVLNAGDELLEEPPSLMFGHAAVCHNVIEELSTSILSRRRTKDGGRGYQHHQRRRRQEGGARRMNDLSVPDRARAVETRQDGPP